MRRSRTPVAVVAAALALPLAACNGGTTGTGSSMSQQTGAPTPTATRSAEPAPWIGDFVKGMSLEQKVGQLFVPTFADRADAERMIRRYHVGGFIYFPGNARDPVQTARLSNALQRASEIPLLLGVDEEQGLVTRLPYLTKFPGNMALGATAQPGLAREAARVTGTELRALGINQNYAPVADVNVNPANPVIGVRSFGSDPALVSQMLGGAVQGYQDAGVAATAKHFPGHGDTDVDSHTGLPVIRHTRQEWERLDAPPFQAAVRQGVDAIMTAHIVVPGLDDSGDPATMSRTVLTGLLRQKLGYRGVIVTDSLQMAGARQKYGATQAAVRAVQAGADQLLMPPNLAGAHAAVVSAVRRGAITRQRLDESVTRILALKARRGLFGDVQVDPRRAAQVVGSRAHQEVARRVAEASVTLVRNKGGALPLRNGTRVHVAGPHAPQLAAALRKRNVRIAGSPQAADVVVLTTQDAGAATAARIRAMGGRPVVAVALGRPYDLAHAGAATATLATYSSGNVSLNALARVLTGQTKPAGRLPVQVSGLRFGHGLTY
ncbi:glycoside hydrolase family 3 protein [Thermomonospora amylolytica]|uniref:glycoside hydrolase family 3 protein n=1 Tax=Thermomonospora amylolytica TaxID=1411117 RepID=UPI001F2EA73B|nr:glycoside hydrolase family 3 protein [Thermomonospora amylolytica]